MHGVLCHLCDVGPLFPGEKLGGPERLCTAPPGLRGTAGAQEVPPVPRGAPTQGPGDPRKTEIEDGVTGLQQPPLCIREEAKFITAHYGVRQMS